MLCIASKLRCLGDASSKHYVTCKNQQLAVLSFGAQDIKSGLLGQGPGPGEKIKSEDTGM